MSEFSKRLLFGKTSASKVSKSTKRYVKNAIQSSIETKLLHIGNATVGIGDGIIQNGVDIAVGEIPQGISQHQRIGNRVSLMKYSFTGFMDLGDAQNLVRVILYSPKDPSDTMPLSVVLNSVIDFDRFTVYQDRYVSANGAGEYYRPFEINHKWARGKTQLYDGALATDGTVGVLRMYFCSDSTAAPNPTIRYRRKLTYKDA